MAILKTTKINGDLSVSGKTDIEGYLTTDTTQTAPGDKTFTGTIRITGTLIV